MIAVQPQRISRMDTIVRINNCYLPLGIYPKEYRKPDKQALWKRVKFFRVKGVIYYIGGFWVNHDPVPERLVVEDQIQRRRTIASANDSHLASSLALKMKPFPSKIQSIKKRTTEAMRQWLSSGSVGFWRLIRWFAVTPATTCVVVPPQALIN